MARQFILKREEAAPVALNLTIGYAEQLNPQQYAVVTSGKGAILVVAGAGTGKTRTLIYRVAYLIETGTKPEEILLLTFTRRAAKEMLSRASLLLDGRCERVNGGTFHAFCLQILSQYAKKIGYPQPFNVLDASDAADVINVLRTAKGFHQSKQRFPRKESLSAIFSTMANRQMSLESVLEREYPQFISFIEEISLLHSAYQAYKKQHGLMDYDDLMSETLHLFQQFPDVAKSVSAKYKHVLVDEYQDTNKLQAELVQWLSRVHGNVMAVGDDAQSIYRFRGADFRNIMDFPKLFQGAEVLKLEQNYRSTQPILNVTNYVLSQAKEKYDKHLFTQKMAGELPAIVQAPDDHFQSRFVCQMILQLREENLPLNEMAVLFRNSRDSYDLEVELNKKKIPFVKYGGVRLSDAAHIKDVLAHIKVLENPRDVVSWQRVLLLLEGLGPRTVFDMMEWLEAASNEPFELDQQFTTPRYVEHLRALLALFKTLQKPETTVSAQIEAIVQYYEPIVERIHTEDADKRIQDLSHFVGLTANYGTRNELLTALALDPIERSAIDTEASFKDEPPLILSTIHSAKGLEFHSVFLIQAIDGILPSAYALNSDEALDEERRLMYVALTRAEENLFISYPVLAHRRSFGDYFAKPSRFLDQLPKTLAEPWQLVEESAQPKNINALPEMPSPHLLGETEEADDDDDDYAYF